MFGALHSSHPPQPTHSSSAPAALAAVSKVVSYGRPALGGPWELVNKHGEPVTDADFRGEYVLLYFGFTYCPDICPNEMIKMGKVIQELGMCAAGATCRVHQGCCGLYPDSSLVSHAHTHTHRQEEACQGAANLYYTGPQPRHGSSDGSIHSR